MAQFDLGSFPVSFETDAVVVGTGPAGGSMATFLGSYGIKGLIIGMASTTATGTPRAHLTNMAALECLRDVDLEAECIKLGNSKADFTHVRWGRTIAGEEYARIPAWGNGAAYESQYKLASPCDPIDLPQPQLEPILIRKAVTSGFVCRFDTEFIAFDEDPDEKFVDVLVRDLLFDRIVKIRTKYLFGADGARGKILKQLGLPVKQGPGGGVAWNILFKADLSKYIEKRPGNLHWCYQHDLDHPDFAWTGFLRMVKPWNEWVFIVFPEQNYQMTEPPTEEQWRKRIRQCLGDDEIPFEISDISKWMVNDIVAEQYSKGRIFCLGDAVHRHPPSNGLGSNTCIQDAYNLAWKIAYVLKGLAGPQLLDSYNKERQPVGEGIVKRAFQGFLDHHPLWQASGILGPDAKTRTENLEELSADNEAGRKRRKAFIEGVRRTRYEYQGIGIEMNQRYVSNAVHQSDDGAMPPLKGDPVLEHHKTTYPGARLPHAWLDKPTPEKQISTHDICGKGNFTILTGIGGSKWKDAARHVSDILGICIRAFSIGFRQDYADTYFEWEDIREVEENGCILVRPDRFIAWRSKVLVKNCDETLLEVLKKILSREIEA